MPGAVACACNLRLSVEEEDLQGSLRSRSNWNDNLWVQRDYVSTNQMESDKTSGVTCGLHMNTDRRMALQIHLQTRMPVHTCAYTHIHTSSSLTTAGQEKSVSKLS